MLKRGDRVLAGVSGGPDSVALLLALHSLKKELKIKLYVASLNHMFRKDAADDVKFVKNLAVKLKVPFYTEKIDVPALHKSQGGSKEDLARRFRYEFFLRAAKRFKANKIALGHTRDDQAETVLMRLIYGAGITGLSAIPATRKTGSSLIVRPLIETTRIRIDSYLKQNRVKARMDSTNLQAAYKRNKIRSRLIPILEKEYNPNIKEALARTADLLRDDKDVLEEVLLKKVFAGVIKPDKAGAVRLSLKRFDKLHTALQKYVLRECIRRVNTRLAGIEYRHWRLLKDFIAKRKNGASWHLPYGCRVMIKKGNILFYNVG
jgi:tRNA(Ile)-lysidine synthase